MFLLSLLPVLSVLANPAASPSLNEAVIPPRTDSISTTQETETSRFQYNFVEADVAVGDLSGLQLGASYGLDDSLFLTGTFAYLSAEEGPVDLDFTTFSGGVTYVMRYLPKLDFLGTAELEYGRVEASFLGASASDTEFGLRLRAAARYAIDDRWEAFGGVTVRTILDNNFAIDAGVRYQFSDALAFQARLELGDDSFLAFGVRYSL